MIDRHARRPLFALAMVVMFVVACGSSRDEEPGGYRTLDAACANGACKLEGAAKLTTGITADSIGIRLGPGNGKVRVPLFQASVNPDYTIDALVAGPGTLGRGAPLGDVALGKDYAWTTVESGHLDAPYSAPDNLNVVVELSNPHGETIDIADVRYQTYGGCGNSTPGRY